MVVSLLASRSGEFTGRNAAIKTGSKENKTGLGSLGQEALLEAREPSIFGF
jgi:hypothetical protein